MARCSSHDMLEVANCYSCLDTRQVEYFKAAILCAILRAINPMAVCDIKSLLGESACFACLDNHQLQLVQTELLCEILQAGGGGGTSCNLCGTADPVAAPTCDCALYTRTDTGEIWYWEPVNTVWVKILSNT